MAGALGLFSVIFCVVLVCRSGYVSESAWNGFTTGSTTLAPFTPYYVPAGAKGYDSASPLVTYTGIWTDSFSTAYQRQQIHSTSQPNASVWFKFIGTGIEWFGNTDESHGVAQVFIDGKLARNVDTWSAPENSAKNQRLFWNYNLSFGTHTLKIMNTAKRPGSQKNTKIDVDAFVVTRGGEPNSSIKSQYQFSPLPSRRPTPLDFLSHQNLTSPKRWILTAKGTTGVHAMQLAIISSTHAIIIDKVEHNPLTISGHPAWAALYNLETDAVKPLDMQSNSFCAGGTFLRNGTLINVGGNPVVIERTSSADFGDVDGLQAIRIFQGCLGDNVDNCNVYENHSRVRLASPRWYNTVLRISDGSAMIIGGSKRGGWMNNATVNNPTIEFYPPKNIHSSNGLPIQMAFLKDTLNSNLFPIAFSLPDGKIFIAANRDAMIYDWKTNTERRLPQIPNGVRITYPMTGTGLLLPLSPENNYTPEILLCGGSTVDDWKPNYEISSQDPASSQCSRLVLTNEGIKAGWDVDYMPEARLMPDAVLLPNGEIVIVNGAQSGIAGYGNVLNQVGASNADNPAQTPVLYNPTALKGERFSSEGMPTSNISRLYHSVATLTPSGDVMIAGSNPNLDRSELKYGTEYRVEWLSPPYMQAERPFIMSIISQIEFGKSYQLQVKLPENYKKVEVVLMDLGYVTHAVHANTRLVYLQITKNEQGSLTILGAPNENIYPPGPGWIFVTVDGVPSKGMKVMVGDGNGPPIDKEALENVLKLTTVN